MKIEKINLTLIVLVISFVFMNFLFYQGCGRDTDLNIGTITGTVYDKSGNVMAGRKVEIDGSGDTIGIAIQDTNVQGRFTYTNIPVGLYLITVKTQENVFIASKQVNLEKQETMEITIVEGEIAEATPTPATPTMTPNPSGTVVKTSTPMF